MKPTPSSLPSGAAGPTLEVVDRMARVIWMQMGCPDGSQEDFRARARALLADEALGARVRSLRTSAEPGAGLEGRKRRAKSATETTSPPPVPGTDPEVKPPTAASGRRASHPDSSHA